MRSFATLAAIAAVSCVTAAPALAGPTVTAGGHTIASLVMGPGRKSPDDARSNVGRAGLTAGIDLEIGSDPGAVAIVIEQLWRYPAAYSSGRERTIVIEYRHHFARRRGGRGGFVGFGGGVRRADHTDETGAMTLRGYDFRLDSGIAAAAWTATVLHVRFGINYGCYTRAVYDDGRRDPVGCLETLLGQMFIGVDLARRW